MLPQSGVLYPIAAPPPRRVFPAAPTDYDERNMP